MRSCYAFVKNALQTAGLVAKHQPRGRHRRLREPRACVGELHLDGSRQRWLALLPERWLTHIAVVDDATQRVRYVELREGGEGVAAIMTALLAVLERYGAPMAVTCCSAARRAESSPSAGIPDEEKSVTARAYAARKGHSSPQSS